MMEQLLELTKDDRALELLDLVEHEDHGRRSLAEPLNEPNDRVVGGRFGRQGADPLERELHPEPELGAPVVVAVDREPRDVVAAGGPRCEEHRLSRARVGRGERHRSLDAGCQQVEQPRTLDVPLRKGRGRQLRGENRLRRSSVGRITTARGLGARHRSAPFQGLEQQVNPRRVRGKDRSRTFKVMPGQLLSNAQAPVITQAG
jgi:hypothetical protein